MGSQEEQLAQDVGGKCKLPREATKTRKKVGAAENNNLDECISKNDAGRESANSSPAASCSESTSSHDEGYELSSSGRSSSSESHEQRTGSPDSQTSGAGAGAGPAKLLNPHSNHFPAEFAHLAEELRVRFLEELDGDGHAYDERDIEQLRRGPIPVDCTAVDKFEPEQSVAFRWVSRFISSKALLEPTKEKLERETEEALERLREFLKFRKQLGLSRVSPDQFAREFYVMSGIFPFGVDKWGVPVLYLRARIHRRWSAKLNESFQRYVAWQIDVITKSRPDTRAGRSVGSSGREKDGSFGICFDCLSVSYSCLDMDFLRYLVRLLVHNYPTYCRYALCVDLPWIFRSVWKLVRSWLPEDAQNSVQLITSRQLTEFIDEHQIPNSIKFNDLAPREKPAKNRHAPPESQKHPLRGIGEFADELGLSPGEVKQFVAHVDKVRKEYEQLGAI